MSVSILNAELPSDCNNNGPSEMAKHGIKKGMYAISS